MVSSQGRQLPSSIKIPLHKIHSFPDTITNCRDRFFRVVMKPSGSSDLHNHHGHEQFNWYCRFLEGRFETIRESHFIPCVQPSVLNQSLDLCRLYNLTTTIIELVAKHQDISLDFIVGKLLSQEIFILDKSNSYGLMNQLTFIALGWLCMLYDPEWAPKEGLLQIRRDTRLSGRILRSYRIRTIEQGFTQISQPLPTLLRVFGHIVPELPVTSGITYQSNTDYLILSYLNYHTLNKVCNIKIEWVDSLSLHLEFVEAQRVLKLFRFPSFCAMAYFSKGDCACRSLLTGTSTYKSSPEDAKDYFREVLLSYRLLFGQDSKSASCFNSDFKKSLLAPIDAYRTVPDPLLPRLCGKVWRAEKELYDALDASEAPNHYSPGLDFPCLGDKLLKLQRFSREMQPHSWKVLWSDRRDIQRFYTFWAVLWIGGGTILVGIVGIVMAGLQLQAANEQNRLQMSQLQLQLEQMRAMN